MGAVEVAGSRLIRVITKIFWFFAFSLFLYFRSWLVVASSVDSSIYINPCASLTSSLDLTSRVPPVSLNDCFCIYFYNTIFQWDLVCDLKWMKPTFISIQFGGLLTGAILGGQSGDYFGRKKTLYGSYLLHTLLNVICAYSVNWQMFAAMRYFIGVMIGMIG